MINVIAVMCDTVEYGVSLDAEHIYVLKRSSAKQTEKQKITINKTKGSGIRAESNRFVKQSQKNYNPCEKSCPAEPGKLESIIV